MAEFYAESYWYGKGEKGPPYPHPLPLLHIISSARDSLCDPLCDPSSAVRSMICIRCRQLMIRPLPFLLDPRPLPFLLDPRPPALPSPG